MFKDREIRLTLLLAALSWGGMIFCLISSFVVYAMEPFGHRDYAFLVLGVGLGFSAVAATLSIRSYLCVFSTRLKEAFELGRETAKHGDKVRQFR